MKVILKFFIFCLSLVFLLCPGIVLALEKGSLAQRLALEEGLNETLVAQFYQADQTLVDTAIIAKNLKQVEYKATYDRFLTPPSVGKAQKFLDQNRRWMKVVEKKYGVEAELITAIFLIESDLGRYPGRYSLLQVFTSLASCNQEKHLRTVYKELLPKFPELDYQWLKRRARKKSTWGYEQLVALLRLADRLEVDQVKGSWAGAFGICQFIPSSCLRYAVDGNGDGRIDLYDFQDAAASVANYLKLNGWRSGLDRKAQEKVVWSYNHSQLYCRTIVELSKRLQ
ncbi:MAG: lytic murein transglycosylase [Deltaproteobacteria bacterium]|nr:lytic murein transglycosylase [Candidatus Tharpella aukensis]